MDFERMSHRLPGEGPVISFILSLMMALNLAMFLNDPKTNLSWGATAGFLAGFGWVAMGIGIVSLFEHGRGAMCW